jgi:hypothetical protein
VNTHLLNNTVAWSQTIKDSGYKPHNIVELVKDKLYNADINIVLETISFLNLFGF